MGRELFAGITVGNVTYLGVVLLVGVLVAATLLITAGRLKHRLRRRNRTNLTGQLVDDVEEVVAELVLLGAIYLGLLGLPPLDEYRFVLRQALIVVSISLVVYAAIRVQADTLNWYIKRVGRRTAQAKVLNSLLPMGKRISALVILAMGVLIVLDQLGLSIAPLVAGLGIGGLAVALALQGTLTNFFAGLNMLTDGSVRVGDFVELDGGMSGYVDQIGWRSTRIRLLANNMVIIPNSKLADSITTNYNYPEDEMSVYLQVGVGYFSDLDHVERVTVEVAKKIIEETPGSVTEYEPSVWYTEFGDSNINFWVVLRSQGYVDSWLLKHNFIKALFRRFNEEGIEISFPNRNVFVREGAVEPQPGKNVEEKVRTAASRQKEQAKRGKAPPPPPDVLSPGAQGDSPPDGGDGPS